MTQQAGARAKEAARDAVKRAATHAAEHASAHLSGKKIARHFTVGMTGTGFSAAAPDRELAVSRVRMLAIAVACLWLADLVIGLVIWKLAPEYFDGRQRTLDLPSLFRPVVLSVVALVLLRIGRFPLRLRLGIAVGYVISVGILVSVAEVSRPWWLDGQRMTGVPWVSLWVLAVPLVVPIGWGRAVARGVFLSLLPVLVMFAGTRWFDLPPAPLTAYLDFYVPCLVAALLGTIIARMMYRLTRQAQQAQQLGSYQLEEKIGSGGMGEVWRACHEMLVRPAAVKLIRPQHLALTPGEDQNALLARFHREAQATATLRSPHTVELYDFGVSEDGTFFYVMELLEGLDLEGMIKRFGPLPPGRVVYLLQQMCCSLADAHACGLLHRDIKPANIYICRVGQQTDYVKVLDFGLVKSVATSRDNLTLTAANTVLGTPAFMAPEVVEGKAADHRLDLYALGCVAYWMLTGNLVFDADTPLAMAVAHAKQQPPTPSRLSELTIPRELDRIILDCLAKDPADRPADAGELAARLDACKCDDPWSGPAAKQWWDMHLAEFDGQQACAVEGVQATQGQ